jgi:peptide/nickel transport system substrate-binding protein
MATSISTVATTVPAPASADVPRQGGTLRFGNIGDLFSLEGQTLRPDGSADHLFSVWDRLVAADSSQQPKPMLAESWEIADNYQQITFNLRRGVLFHTGRELTANDVKSSLLRIQDPKIASTLTGRMTPMTAIETPDDYTVILNASRPWVEAFDVLQQANIIDPVTFQTAGLSKPTGTGPFMFAEYAQGDHLRLVKNTNYWGHDGPYLDEVLISIYSDAQAAVVALEAGALDLISAGLPVLDTLRLQKDPQYQVLVNDRTGTSWDAFLNCTREPTNDKLVRQALSYALDRQHIANAVWQGLEKPIALPWSPASPAYDASKNGLFAFDLDKARSLLAQAGLKNTRLDIVWPAGPPEYSTLAQIYQANLAKLGFEVALKPLEAGAINALNTGLDYQGVRLGQFSLGQLKPASGMLGMVYGPNRNFSGFTSDAYSQLVNQAVTETDPVRQSQLYGQINDYYLDQAWTLPIVPSPERAAVRTNVRGIRYDGRPGLVPAEVWLA